MCLKAAQTCFRLFFLRRSRSPTLSLRFPLSVTMAKPAGPLEHAPDRFGARSVGIVQDEQSEKEGCVGKTTGLCANEYFFYMNDTNRVYIF